MSVMQQNRAMAEQLAKTNGYFLPGSLGADHARAR